MSLVNFPFVLEYCKFVWRWRQETVTTLTMRKVEASNWCCELRWREGKISGLFTFFMIAVRNLASHAIMLSCIKQKGNFHFIQFSTCDVVYIFYIPARHAMHHQKSLKLLTIASKSFSTATLLCYGCFKAELTRVNSKCENIIFWRENALKIIFSFSAAYFALLSSSSEFGRKDEMIPKLNNTLYSMFFVLRL